jgi:hypothetical protein
MFIVLICLAVVAAVVVYGYVTSKKIDEMR